MCFEEFTSLKDSSEMIVHGVNYIAVSSQLHIYIIQEYKYVPIVQEYKIKKRNRDQLTKSVINITIRVNKT